MNKQTRQSCINWILGMILCPLGVTFSAKSGFGVSMIEAPVYVSYLKLSDKLSWITFGTCEYILQAFVLILLCLAIRRFKWRYLLSFVTAVIYGFILDGWRLFLGQDVFGAMPMRILSALIGIVITALAVAFFFRTSLPQEVWELFVKELAERYGFSMTKVKWIYDISSLLVGIIIMLLCFHAFRLEAIGIGTIVTTIVNAPIIGAWGKVIDKIEKPKQTVS